MLFKNVSIETFKIVSAELRDSTVLNVCRSIDIFIAIDSGNGDEPNRLHRGYSDQLTVSGDDVYSAEEKKVLLTTSRINKHEFVPFMSIDLNERSITCIRVLLPGTFIN